MIEIRFHGRGGQGAVVASKVLAVAFFQEGLYVQSFPAFGAERRGAPVAAYTRADREPIRMHTYIYQPDHVVVLDPMLPGTVDVKAGLKEGGWIVINTDKLPSTFTDLEGFKRASVDANRIAVAHGLGTPTAPIVNTAILGAFARATGCVGIDAICEAIHESVPTHPEANAAACREAYKSTHL